MDDHKKPKLDPLFDDILKRAFPGAHIPPMRRPAPPRVPLPDIIYDIDKVTRPAPPPALDTYAILELQQLIEMIQRRMPPPTPLNKFEERLYNIAVDMGYKPRDDTFFGCNPKTKAILVDRSEVHQATRLLAISHELGHATRFNQGKVDADIASRWHTRRLGADNRVMARTLLREEIIAWRIGAQLLRKVGAKFNSTALLRAQRQGVLMTYRLTTKIYGAKLDRLQIREE